jgi:hypothetical protein
MIAPARQKPLGARWLVLALVPVLGCGGSGGVPRLAVYGTVAHPSGDKIDGLISFVPDQGRTGPSAVGSIVKGAYQFDKTNGPTSGPHRVIVTRTGGKEMAVKPAGAAKRPPKGPKSAVAAGPLGPWTFSRDIPENGPYQIDLQLP